MSLEYIWNPWHGCKKYSEGCLNCYMYYLDRERGNDGSKIYRVKNNFNLPLKRTRDGKWKIPAGALLHVCLTSDFFLEEADRWRDEAWDIMRNRKDINYFLLTKRAERIVQCLPYDWGGGWEHVRINITAENQRRVDERMPVLLSLPAKHKGIMLAPLLSAIDLTLYLESGQIENVLADGENYDGARPCRYEWIKSLSDQCRMYKVPFTFCGTGNVFIKDGKVFHICKAYQSIMALRSKLSYPEPSNIPEVQKRCAECSRRFKCGGCSYCGDCGNSCF
ncbi:MAG: DUF5131 family protein [Clostridia bacterium]|nr:DUF5131 family protein [Clostridia bacterium]